MRQDLDFVLTRWDRLDLAIIWVVVIVPEDESFSKNCDSHSCRVAHRSSPDVDHRNDRGCWDHAQEHADRLHPVLVPDTVDRVDQLDEQEHEVHDWRKAARILGLEQFVRLDTHATGIEQSSDQHGLIEKPNKLFHGIPQFLVV